MKNILYVAPCAQSQLCWAVHRDMRLQIAVVGAARL